MTDENEETAQPAGAYSLWIRQSPIDMTHTTPALQAALASAQQQAGLVMKRGQNTERGYNYATADDMIAAATIARHETGLALLTNTSSEPPPEPEEYGNQWVCSVVTLHWVLTHADGGFLTGFISGPAIARRGTPRDKAEAAITTYLEGYLERSLFRLARSEVPQHEEVDQRNDHAQTNDGTALVDLFTAADTVDEHRSAYAEMKAQWDQLSSGARNRVTAAKRSAAARIKATLAQDQAGEEPQVEPSNVDTTEEE